MSFWYKTTKKYSLSALRFESHLGNSDTGLDPRSTFYQVVITDRDGRRQRLIGEMSEGGKYDLVKNRFEELNSEQEIISAISELRKIVLIASVMLN